MDIKEVSNMSLDSERMHWWIQTRFCYIDKAIECIERLHLNITEFGCGTGQNIWYLRNQSAYSDKVNNIVGIDPELPKQFINSWSESKDTLSNDLTDGIVNSDLVLAMDVLEHIEDDEQALSQWSESLDEKGLILITVPAFQSLWSYHDEYLDHKRRYTKGSLNDVAKRCGLESVFLNYAFGHIFPAVYIARKLLPQKKGGGTDLVLPNTLINQTLKTLGRLEARAGGNRYFGTSVVGIFKKG